MFSQDYLDERFQLRGNTLYTAAGGVLGTVANPANIVLWVGASVSAFVQSIRLSTDVVSAGQIFRLTADPGLAAGNAIQGRNLQNAGGSGVTHEFAVAVSPATAGIIAAFRSGPQHLQLLGPNSSIRIPTLRGMLIQFPALAINISYTIAWYEAP